MLVSYCASSPIGKAKPAPSSHDELYSIERLPADYLTRLHAHIWQPHHASARDL